MSKKGQKTPKWRLVYEGKDLQKGLLSDEGKYDAMQILNKLFDEGRPDAIDPDEVEAINVLEQEKDD
tara:strand:- start:1319 stop:1519 length:201 start_codon:yes stop_codon:yes gene_type:complete